MKQNKNNPIKLKVFGANDNSRIVRAYTILDISKYAKCYKKWEYL